MVADVPGASLATPGSPVTLTLAPVILAGRHAAARHRGAVSRSWCWGGSSPGSRTPWRWSAASPRSSRIEHGPRASVRLNIFEFAGMLGVLGGLAVVGSLPERWGWNVSLLAATTPVLVALAAALALRRRLPARDRAVAPAGPRREPARRRGGAPPPIVRADVRARRRHGARVVGGEPVRDPAPGHARVRPRPRGHLVAARSAAAPGPGGAPAGGLARRPDRPGRRCWWECVGDARARALRVGLGSLPCAAPSAARSSASGWRAGCCRSA